MVIQFRLKYINFSEVVENLPAKFYFSDGCCILEMMNQNQPKLLPLYLILIGSLILAIPGAYGGLFLFIFAFEAISKPYQSSSESGLVGLLFPMPVIIGFLLLAGYIWTAWHKRFVKWFWWSSAIFNVLVTLLSGGLLVKLAYENITSSSSPNILALLFFLFPIWTLFVTIASVKYAFFKPANENINLP